jgi:hypothetical protein
VKDAEKKEIRQWVGEVMPLYRQTEALVRIIAQTDSDGLPTDIKNLSEILIYLPPILDRVKRMTKPKSSKLQHLQKDFKLMLNACIKSARYRLKIEKKQNRLWFSTAVFWTNLAISFQKALSPEMEKLFHNFSNGEII